MYPYGEVPPVASLDVWRQRYASKLLPKDEGRTEGHLADGYIISRPTRDFATKFMSIESLELTDFVVTKSRLVSSSLVRMISQSSGDDVTIGEVPPVPPRFGAISGSNWRKIGP